MHESVMARAIELARGRRTHPNPTVGAVLVEGDTVVGEGFHAGPGQDHAEVMALAQAGSRARDATLYVTLEPCSHHGRTPPCVDAVLAAGIGRVVVGATDPDERVSGRGIELLREGGVTVETGVLADEVEALDPAYFHHRRTGLPRVTLKLALTLDGQVSAADGSSQWITGEAARADAHRLRSEADAVLVGAGTLRADDPLLTVRLPGFDGPQPRPVVVAGSAELPAERKLWDRRPIVLTPTERQGPYETKVVAAADGRVDMRAGLAWLADEAGYLDVLAEGGAGLAASLLDAGLATRIVLYYGAVVAGGLGMGAFAGTFATLADAHGVEITAVERIGEDVKVECTPRGP